jgi:hypothetical protein
MHAMNHPVIALLVATAIWADSAFASGRGTLAREFVEAVVGRGGREVAEKAARESTEQAVEVVAKQALDARNISTIAKELGPEALKLEAKAPGIAERVLNTFGAEGARTIATTVPAEDIPRLVAYADRADTPATRKALLEAYEKEGPSLFERIPPKLVLAGGLTTAAIYGTHRATAPMAALGDQIERDPDLARRTLDWLGAIGGSAVLLVTAGFMRWAGLFGRRPAPTHAKT